MTTATMTSAQAAQALLPYVRPGFAQQFRAMGKEVGYRQLGRSLRWLAVPEVNGHKETVVVSPKPRARKGTCECGDARHYLPGKNPPGNGHGGLRAATGEYKGGLGCVAWGSTWAPTIPSEEHCATIRAIFSPTYSTLVPRKRGYIEHTTVEAANHALRQEAAS